MTAMVIARPGRGRRSLLSKYTERCGDAIRRSQSTVALRAAKVDAELAYRARGALLASMNHELRTPLNAITGFAGLLKQAEEMNLTPEQRGEYLDYILQSADLLLSHINTILEIADAESGGAKLSRRAFDVGDVINQVTETLDEQSEGAPLHVTMDLPSAVPPVNADPDKIAVALRHLLTFMRGGVTEAVDLKVTVRAGLAGKSANFVYVALEGSGQLYTQADIQTALRVFERVHEGLDRKFEGHRLGLPIAKSYIELNQGKFSIKTSSEGALLVRFALPVARGEHQETFERLAS